MIELFKSGRCGRVLYFCLLFLLVGFDFAKGPIEHFLVAAKDGVQGEIYASDGSGIAQGERSFVEELRVPDQGMHNPASTVEEHASGTIARTLAMEAKSSAVGAVYLSMLAAMGFATIVAIIWMVFARVRDIGWPGAAGFGVLAPKLAISVLPGSLPALAFDILQYGFVGAVIALGLVPGRFTDRSSVVPGGQSAMAEPVRRRRNEFGQKAR